MIVLRSRRLAFIEVAPLPPSTDTKRFFTPVLQNARHSKDHRQRLLVYYEALLLEGWKIKVFDKLNEKAGKVLEIGIGSGPNMGYYATRNSNLTLFGLDPNPKIKKYARKSAAQAGFKSKKFRFKQGVGEAIPLKDDSMDAVVTTLVLCSVSDITQTLKEIKRVLRPGGTFIFLEHIAAKDGSMFRLLQKLLNPLQQRLADGCHLTRNTRECILEAGFSGGVEIETFTMCSFPWVTGPHIYGVAYK